MRRPTLRGPRAAHAAGPSRGSRQNAWTGLFLAFVILVVALDLATDRRWWISVLLLVVPGLAAGVCSVSRTALIGGSTVVALVLLYGISPRYGGSPGDWLTICSAAAVAAVGTVISRYRLRREADLMRARVTLRALQRTVLQTLPLRTADVEVHGFYVPAEAEALVGGDIYGAVESPYGTRLLIGDVQGKGLDAIYAGAAVLSAFRESGYHLESLGAVADRLEEAVRRHNRRVVETGQPERFVTALLVEFTPDGPLSLVSRGHPSPLLVSGGRVAVADCPDPGPPLGLADLVSGPPAPWRLEPAPGDLLLLCTDGVLEARNGTGVFYPLPARVAGLPRSDPSALVRGLRADLERHAEGHLGDDAAALVVRRGGI
ncbi:PP2C family protein-serine/threonine phosphatase [Peterkaempfera sp. SMS 1(5)a]|uniref:PP2C family protein-serine/threonine phosphatase n=1 Tax=Peterkaempfera podocarpi TaxID=3232308 RepID=UPI00366FE901